MGFSVNFRLRWRSLGLDQVNNGYLAKVKAHFAKQKHFIFIVVA